ncbi:MAG: hypothetical protein ACK55Z_17770, partial [bacterium]
WNGGQFLQLPESGIQPPQSSAYLDPGGGLWQKQGGQMFRQNGERHAVADNAGKRRQEGADRRNNVRNGRGKPEGAAAMVRPTGSREEANKTALEKGSTNRR